MADLERRVSRFHFGPRILPQIPKSDLSIPDVPSLVTGGGFNIRGTNSSERIASLLSDDGSLNLRYKYADIRTGEATEGNLHLDAGQAEKLILDNEEVKKLGLTNQRLADFLSYPGDFEEVFDKAGIKTPTYFEYNGRTFAWTYQISSNYRQSNLVPLSTAPSPYNRTFQIICLDDGRDIKISADDIRQINRFGWYGSHTPNEIALLAGFAEEKDDPIYNLVRNNNLKVETNSDRDFRRIQILVDYGVLDPQNLPNLIINVSPKGINDFLKDSMHEARKEYLDKTGKRRTKEEFVVLATNALASHIKVGLAEPVVMEADIYTKYFLADAIKLFPELSKLWLESIKEIKFSTPQAAEQGQDLYQGYLGQNKTPQETQAIYVEDLISTLNNLIRKPKNGQVAALAKSALNKLEVEDPVVLLEAVVRMFRGQQQIPVAKMLETLKDSPKLQAKLEEQIRSHLEQAEKRRVAVGEAMRRMEAEKQVKQELKLKEAARLVNLLPTDTAQEVKDFVDKVVSVNSETSDYHKADFDKILTQVVQYAAETKKPVTVADIAVGYFSQKLLQQVYGDRDENEQKYRSRVDRLIPVLRSKLFAFEPAEHANDALIKVNFNQSEVEQLPTSRGYMGMDVSRISVDGVEYQLWLAGSALRIFESDISSNNCSLAISKYDGKLSFHTS